MPNLAAVKTAFIYVVCPSAKKPMPLKIARPKSRRILDPLFFNAASSCFPAECFTSSSNFFINLTTHTAALIIFFLSKSCRGAHNPEFKRVDKFERIIVKKGIILK